MYLDPDSYADYINAYKTFILDTAKIMTRFVHYYTLEKSSVVIEIILRLLPFRELGENVGLDLLGAAVENIFAFEVALARVSKSISVQQKINIKLFNLVLSCFSSFPSRKKTGETQRSCTIPIHLTNLYKHGRYVKKVIFIHLIS